MQKGALLDRLRAIRGELSKEGSPMWRSSGHARADNRDDSDVDLFIDVEHETSFSILNLVRVEQIMSDKIGVPANAFMRRSLAAEFRDSIQADVIEIF